MDDILTRKILENNNIIRSRKIIRRDFHFPETGDINILTGIMEHCYDYYCSSLMARLVNDSENEAFFKKRSDYFKNLFDPSSKLMRAKDSKGQWRRIFDSFLLSHASTSGGDYTEGNAWQYTWHIQHDIPLLFELMGSKTYFEIKLDSLFFLDVRSLGSGFHGDVTGLIWAPQVHEATLHLPGGKTFTVKANQLSVRNKYVRSVRLNGKPLKSFSVTYEAIKNGGTLEFEMTDEKMSNFFE